MNFDHENRPFDMGKVHGHISKVYIIKTLGPTLGRGPREVTMHQKVDVMIF
jgi:hypothetical protein